MIRIVLSKSAMLVMMVLTDTYGKGKISHQIYLVGLKSVCRKCCPVLSHFFSFGIFLHCVLALKFRIGRGILPINQYCLNTGYFIPSYWRVSGLDFVLIKTPFIVSREWKRCSRVANYLFWNHTCVYILMAQSQFKILQVILMMRKSSRHKRTQVEFAV